MIYTVGELVKELSALNQDKFIVIHNMDDRLDYAIERVDIHKENEHVNYEIRVGRNVQ